jgi:hypothetical protein
MKKRLHILKLSFIFVFFIIPNPIAANTTIKVSKDYVDIKFSGKEAYTLWRFLSENSVEIGTKTNHTHIFWEGAVGTQYISSPVITCTYYVGSVDSEIPDNLIVSGKQKQISALHDKLEKSGRFHSCIIRIKNDGLAESEG